MEQLTGNEEFTLHGASAGISVKDYWSWAYSDLIDNTQRGVMAEFLVYSSLKSNYPPPPPPKSGKTGSHFPCQVHTDPGFE